MMSEEAYLLWAVHDGSHVRVSALHARVARIGALHKNTLQRSVHAHPHSHSARNGLHNGLGRAQGHGSEQHPAESAHGLDRQNC